MDAFSQQIITGTIFALIGFVLGWYISRSKRPVADDLADAGTPEANLLALLEQIRASTDGQQEMWNDLRELVAADSLPSANEIRAHKHANWCYGQLMKSYRSQLKQQDPDGRVVSPQLADDVSENAREAEGLSSTLGRMEIDPQHGHVPKLLQRLAQLENSNRALREELNVAREQIAEQTVRIEHAETAALEDHLTRLPNRRAFEQRLREILAGFQRYGRPFCLLMLDLDHFKQLNDEHGHQAGDAALQLAARLMRETCRTADHVARFGGEEFAIIASDTRVAGAQRLAERLRERMANASLIHDGETLRFTCSIGVAEVDVNHDAEQLMAAADAALYAAKENGRNTIHTAAAPAAATD